MAAEGEDGKVRLRTYNEYITGEVPRKGDDKPDLAKGFWIKGVMFLAFGLVFLCMMLFLPQESLMSLVMIAAIDALLFVAAAGNLHLYMKSGQEAEAPAGEAVFKCRHCGKGFADERIGKKHESTCVEMKL